MSETVDVAEALGQTAMEKFGNEGMALLPWTRQMLTVVWEQLRLLLQVIYCTFMSVFQMFRFEVHVRITDETGQHIQHMSTTSNSPESFLFSSLFDGDGGVMVGGSNPLSDFCADAGDHFTGKSTAEALLSSLRADDLCCGLVDDFVSRTAGTEDGIFLGHQSTWKMGFPGDWNIFVSSSDSSASNDGCQKKRPAPKFFQRDFTRTEFAKAETSDEDRSSTFSSEEDVVEFDSEESRALWESLSQSSDPYNPFFFSACISTNTEVRKRKTRDDDSDAATKNSETRPEGLSVWVSRSDSESSWTSSDDSSPDVDRDESERLWEFFSNPADPYNPLSFTACTISSSSLQPTSARSPTARASLPAPPSRSDSDEESTSPPSSEDDEAEQLWKVLSHKDDPFHPLNFQACLQSSATSTTTTTPGEEDPRSPGVRKSARKTPAKSRKQEEDSKTDRKLRVSRKPPLTHRASKLHSHPDTSMVAWKRPTKRPTPPEEREKRQTSSSSSHKKVSFSPLVQVHVMRTWLFARQESRKGNWEEIARDRDRFQRRIKEAEPTISRCFTQSHRERMREYLDLDLDSALK